METTNELTETQTELIALANIISDYGVAQQLADRSLERKFGGIGSCATLRRILAGEWDRVNAERQLPNYRAVVMLIETVEKSARADEVLYGKLGRVLRIETAIKEALLNEDTTRLVMVQGPTGGGKTTGIALAAQQLKGYDVLFTEADESWRESLLCMANALLEELRGAVRVRKDPNLVNSGSGDARIKHRSGGEAMNDIIRRIDDRKMVMVIDQADELGPRTLNFCTTMINKCKNLVLVFSCMETLWRDLERANYEVARQLSQNRLSERVVIAAAHPTSSEWMCDSEIILRARLKWNSEKDLHDAARLIAEKAGSRGNLKFLTMCIRLSRQRFEDWTVPSHADFVGVVEKVINRR